MPLASLHDTEQTSNVSRVVYLSLCPEELQMWGDTSLDGQITYISHVSIFSFHTMLSE